MITNIKQTKVFWALQPLIVYLSLKFKIVASQVKYLVIFVGTF